VIPQLLALRRMRVERAQQALAVARARSAAAVRERDGAHEALIAWNGEASARERALHASIFHQIITQRRMDEVRGVVSKMRARTANLEQAEAAAQDLLEQAAGAVDAARAARTRAQREAEKVNALSDALAQERRLADDRREDDELDEVVCLSWRST